MASSQKLKNVNKVKKGSLQESSIDVNSPFYVEDEIIISDESNVLQEQINLKMSDIITTNIKCDLNDILIQPKSQTNITTRKDVNPYHKDDHGNDVFPIFTAPMDTVVNTNNYKDYLVNKINVVLPRNKTINSIKNVSGVFNSYGLNDNPHISEDNKYVLLDIANGHMSSVLEWCNKIKKAYPYAKIMAGNIANPKTYKTYCESGVIDYARIGIGNGNGCLTTQHTGIGYPMGSLIIECNEIKSSHKNKVKIIADGGMKEYRDIITSLALGADYVMVGSIFSKTIESSGQKYWKGIKINDNLASKLYDRGFKITKDFRGMSTKDVQKEFGNKEIKTSEGVVRNYIVQYKLSKWVENFEDYLRSCMSYTNSNNLQNFIGKVEYNIITNNAFNRFNK